MLELLLIFLLIYIAFKYAGTLIGAVVKFSLFLIAFMLLFPIILWLFQMVVGIAALFWVMLFV